MKTNLQDVPAGTVFLLEGQLCVKMAESYLYTYEGVGAYYPITAAGSIMYGSNNVEVFIE